MSDIVISIKNYKLLKDYEQELHNCRILLVTGKNEIGKSSLIRALIENMTAKATTDQPVTTGEASGSKTFTIPDKNGDPVIINHEFSEDNKKGTFYAIDSTGRTIRDVNKIRELIGIFEELPIDVFYTMQQSAEGRRKIIKNYFYPLLDKEDLMRIAEIDQRTAKGGQEYDQRTELNSQVNVLSKQMQGQKLTHEEETLADEYEEIMVEYEALRKKQLKYSVDIQAKQAADEKRADLNAELDLIPKQLEASKIAAKAKYERTEAKIAALEAEIVALREDNKELIDEARKEQAQLGSKETELREKLKNLDEATYIDSAEITKIEEDVKTAEGLKAAAEQATMKKRSSREKQGLLLQTNKEITALEKQITDLREEKIQIIKKSKLPKGLIIDGDDFSWNGFVFTDNQVSKSSALLVIAEILCKINTAKIVYIGEKALFDKERFKELVKIAQKHGKIPVLEQVIDDQTEIKVITEIHE